MEIKEINFAMSRITVTTGHAETMITFELDHSELKRIQKEVNGIIRQRCTFVLDDLND